MQPAHDPSRSSYYVTDAYYRDLVQNFSNWQRDELAVAAFQRHFRPAKVDGVIDTSTLATLRALIAAREAL